ncbi:AraC family transcriptional regulator [Reinekea marinisedimentorum]|uniref:Helix-turn-helix protein n=1 Tax=Reinekea marinisedimentorum TaxID=230495 RepID=A0A4R3I1Z5_9GAMM|nr:AraC family transcriptional regulator [Reinekea marinisedimentorum]TCS39767.1 helix-turn-helix protein [Reinekea marinisedimentorum]
MANQLSIRSYQPTRSGHSHPFHQLVLPLRGVISIEVEDFTGKVTPGECVVVKRQEMHHFAADAAAKFVVADLNELPDQMTSSDCIVFAISSPLFQYLAFIEEQLKFQINPNIENLMFQTFYQLLSEQQLVKKLEPRIRKVLAFMEDNLAEELSIEALAGIACLSATQFKKLFKQQSGQTVTEYLTKRRMEKAQALLLHTDYPIQAVAEAVGYSDLSAFSRRFSRYFGLPPSKVSH